MLLTIFSTCRFYHSGIGNINSPSTPGNPFSNEKNAGIFSMLAQTLSFSRNRAADPANSNPGVARGSDLRFRNFDTGRGGIFPGLKTKRRKARTRGNHLCRKEFTASGPDGGGNGGPAGMTTRAHCPNPQEKNRPPLRCEITAPAPRAIMLPQGERRKRNNKLARCYEQVKSVFSQISSQGGPGDTPGGSDH
jgi:hypothetical protein